MKYVDTPYRDEALRRSEERLRLAQDAGGVGSWEYDIESGAVEWSASARRLYGLPPDWRPSYDAFFALLHPEDRERVRAAVEDAIARGVPLDHQFRAIAGGGEVRWIVSRGRLEPSGPDGGMRLIGVDIDVTALKRVEQRLAEREAELEVVQAAAGLAEVELDLRRDYESRYSAAYCKLHGLAVDSPPEHHADWLRRVHPEDRARVVAAVEETLRSDATALTSEYRIVRPATGEVRWIFASFRIERDEAGEAVRLVGSNRDVTAQREHDEALQRSERRLRAILDTMPPIVWSAGPDGERDYFNRRWHDITGLPETVADWSRALHPEDAPAVEKAWRHCLASGVPLENEARLRHADGNYRWHLCRARAIHREDGSIERWYGTCSDIHVRKTLEDARELLARELAHRIKNVFGLIGAIAGISSRDKPKPVRDFVADLRQRLLALSRALVYAQPGVTLLEEMRPSATVFGLMRELVEPFLEPGCERLRLSGADTPVTGDGVTAVALLVHELATNAVKHGALSAPAGRIDVSGRIDGDGVYLLAWSESGGPPVAGPPSKTGFGVQMATRLVSGELGAGLTFDWPATGIVATLRIPAAKLGA